MPPPEGQSALPWHPGEQPHGGLRMKHPDPTLGELVDIQRLFDSSNFTGAACSDDKRRHVFFHLCVLLGKAARAEERLDHGERDFSAVAREVVPDLLVYAAQLSDVFEIDLAEAYFSRLREVEERNSRE